MALSVVLTACGELSANSTPASPSPASSPASGPAPASSSAAAQPSLVAPASAEGKPLASSSEPAASKPASQANPTAVPTAPPVQVQYVAGSSQKVCQLTGEIDHETGKPAASQTASRYGMNSADLGFSFEHNGKVFFLVGDTVNTKTFNGKPNGDNDPPRDRDRRAQPVPDPFRVCFRASENGGLVLLDRQQP